MPLHPYKWSVLVSDYHTIFSERSTHMHHTHTRTPPVQFHPQWQVVQQHLDVVFKPLRVASMQALMHALGISAEHRFACLNRAVAEVLVIADPYLHRI